MTIPRTCPVCGKPLSEDPRERYCSHACRTKAYKDRKRDKRLAEMRGIDLGTDGGLTLVTDEEIASLFMEAAFIAGELERASLSARVSLRPICASMSSAITDVLKDGGMLND